MEENVQELPHLVVEEPKRSPWAVAGIAVLSVMLLAIPVGIYLVSQRTQLTPQAAVTEVTPEVSTGIFLESKLSPEAKSGIIPVDIYIKSPVDAVNLVNAQVKFDPNLVSVEKVATSAAEVGLEQTFNKWLEINSDNSKGQITIISGVPNPGFVNSAEKEKTYLATFHLRPKRAGTTVLEVLPESQILRNSDNQNIYKTGNDLVLNLTSGFPDPSPSASARPRSGENPSSPIIVITNPLVGANYSYFRPLDITWSSFDVDRISDINLFINGEFFGPIAQNLEASAGRFTWQVKDSLPLAYIQYANTYALEITGVSRIGQATKIQAGPFGIVGLEEVVGGPPSPEAFNQNQLTITDASRLLSSYLVFPLKDQSLDFNKDEVVNELDFYLLRQNLLTRSVIK